MGTEAVCSGCSRRETRTHLPLNRPQLPARRASSVSGLLPSASKPQKRAFYVELMRKVSQTAEFRDYVERSALAPTFLAGEDLVSYIEKDRQRVIPLFQEAGWLRQ